MNHLEHVLTISRDAKLLKVNERRYYAASKTGSMSSLINIKIAAIISVKLDLF